MHSKTHIFAITPDILAHQEYRRLSEITGQEIHLVRNADEILARREEIADDNLLVLAEISGMGKEGIEAAGLIHENFPAASVIGYSKLPAPDTIRRAKNVGLMRILTQTQLFEMLPGLLEALPR